MATICRRNSCDNKKKSVKKSVSKKFQKFHSTCRHPAHLSRICLHICPRICPRLCVSSTPLCLCVSSVPLCVIITKFPGSTKFHQSSDFRQVSQPFQTNSIEAFQIYNTTLQPELLHVGHYLAQTRLIVKQLSPVVAICCDLSRDFWIQLRQKL